jgi:ubiquinol-cytochrome c reductase cytochrome c1 subunit
MAFMPTAFAAGGAELMHSGANPTDLASLQRGAQLYMNYCSGCHSANYMRYQRLADDLGLSEEAVMENFVFGDKKIGETMSISMRPEDGQAWFGKAPPDLTVTGRSRGADWIYTYLMSFYEDELGQWNNTVLQNAAMPHVLWQLQGIQKPVYKTVTEGGMEQRVIERLELVSPGSMTPEEYAGAMRDLAAFMDYMSEPAQLKRKSIGIWVLVYLAIFTFIAYLLKREFWRDVH